jgi:hypothetical protein
LVFDGCLRRIPLLPWYDVLPRFQAITR